MSPSQNQKYVFANKILQGDEYATVECPVCHRDTKGSNVFDFVVTLSKGRVLPDMLCFAPAPWFIVMSENAIDAFRKEGITGFVTHKLTIVDAKQNPMDDLNYYILEITGYANIDYDRMGSKVIEYCKCCNYREIEEWKNIYEETWLVEDSWDGSDLFAFNLCTRKVLQVVYKEKLTGFDFKYGIDTSNSLSENEVNLRELFE